MTWCSAGSKGGGPYFWQSNDFLRPEFLHLKKKEQLFPQLPEKCIWQTWFSKFFWRKTRRPLPRASRFYRSQSFPGAMPTLSKNPGSSPVMQSSNSTASTKIQMDRHCIQIWTWISNGHISSPYIIQIQIWYRLKSLMCMQRKKEHTVKPLINGLIGGRGGPLNRLSGY